MSDEEESSPLALIVFVLILLGLWKLIRAVDRAADKSK